MAERQLPRGHGTSMSPESFAQQWSQVRRELKQWWDQLTEGDLEQIAGKKDQLVAMVRSRRGGQMNPARGEGEDVTVVT